MSSTTATATATTNVNANVDANTIEVVAKSAILLPPTVSLGQHEKGKHGKGQLVVALKELDYGEDENNDDDSKNSGVNVDTKVEVDHYRRKINLERYITESVFGHLYRGSEYNYDILSNGNKVGNGEQKCQQQQQKYPQQQLIETHIAKKAVKCIDVHKYNEHQENIRNHRDCSEDPNNEIRIKAHIESKSSINIAFDNHIILPQYVLTNRNQSQSLIQHEGHQKQQQQQKQQQEQEQEQQRKRKRKQQQERYYFIVSQWADGGALIDQFTGLDEDQSKHLFRKMAEGIKYLHDLNIFHRDLKPDNVVTKNECSPSATNVNDCTTNTSAATNTASSSSSSSSSSTIGPTNAETQDAFIIDFGQAQVIQDGVNEIEKSANYGTITYTAPEFTLSQENSHINWRKADIWALGITLYIMLVKLLPPWTKQGILVNSSNPWFQHICRHKKLHEVFVTNHIPLSDDAVDLLQRMLLEDVNERISMNGILSHAWLCV